MLYQLSYLAGTTILAPQQGEGCSGRPRDMSDDELDELILSRLRNRREQAAQTPCCLALTEERWATPGWTSPATGDA
jgi:hypothetical protein